MRKGFLALCLALFTAISVSAQESKYGIANRVGVGVSAGTEGVGFDLSTCLTKYLSVRAGLDLMPDFSINTDANVSGDDGTNYSGTVDIKGALKRTQLSFKLDCYPFPNSSSFFLTAGAVFGGDKVIKITGHSDEFAALVAMGNELGIEIGDYRIPIDKNGNVAGGVKVSGFRPYFGLGFGRLIPKKRIGFRFELGAQIHGKPKVYADGIGDLNELLGQDSDDDVSKLIDKRTVYPVLKFSLRGRIL